MQLYHWVSGQWHKNLYSFDIMVNIRHDYCHYLNTCMISAIFLARLITFVVHLSIMQGALVQTPALIFRLPNLQKVSKSFTPFVDSSFLSDRPLFISICAHSYICLFIDFAHVAISYSSRHAGLMPIAYRSLGNLRQVG